MDEADRDIEMEKDPFLAAGIDIPEELPYQETGKISRKTSRASRSSIENKSHRKLSPRPSIRNDHTDVMIEKTASIINDTLKNANVEQNNSNHKKAIPTLSLTLPTPTNISSNNPLFKTTVETNEGDLNDKWSSVF